MSRKKRSRSNNNKKDKEFLENVIMMNGEAKRNGPKRKSWTLYDLKNIKPLTENQEDMFHGFFQGYNVCACGSAGTGKTYLSLYLASNEVLDKDKPQNKIIIVRSAVSTRELGHLPGDLDEKMAIYENPYRDIMHDLFGRYSTYDDMKERGIIKFMPTSYVRGVTWDDAVVILDEGQNLTEHEISSIMTRIGENTKIIFTGDFKQTDLSNRGNDKSGIVKFIDVAKSMKEFSCVEFTIDDIVRSSFVKSWITACENNNFNS